LASTGARPSRRAVLALGSGAALATVLSTGGRASASTTGAEGISSQLSGLGQEYSARLGVFARNTATDRTALYRANERFPMCSVFKALAAVAVRA
jgi:beta-lactamase class A